MTLPAVAIVVLDGVVDEIAQHEVERGGEGLEARPVSAHLDRQLAVGKRAHDFGDEDGGIDRLDGEFARTGAGVAQQGREHRRQADALVAQLIEFATRLFLVAAAHGSSERIGHVAQGAHR